MAIEKKWLNNYNSVIYVGGGNFFTQAKPTNFHQFWTQKNLLENETVADFKEVTAAERSAIEAADAKWTRPPQSFIDAWNNACIDPRTKRAVGQYNESTGYFELNGLTDITYQEAMEIWKMSYHHCLPVISTGVGSAKVYPPYVFGGSQNFCRTYLPVMLNANYEVIADYMFASNNMVETILILDNGSAVVSFSSSKSIFRGCVKLRKIISKLYFKQYIISSDSEFDGCSSLENVDITFYIGGRSLSFAQSARLSLDSLKKMVLQARWLPSDSSHTSTSTITVHPDVFAKLTGDTTNEAAAALTDDEKAVWAAVLEAACAKNISFATA